MGPTFLRVGIILLGLCALGAMCSSTAIASPEYSTLENSIVSNQEVEVGDIAAELALRSYDQLADVEYYTSLPCANGQCNASGAVRGPIRLVGAVFKGRPVAGALRGGGCLLRAVGRKVTHPFAGVRARRLGRRC